MSRNDGGPAFPLTRDANITYGGMSLRDYFAAQTIIGISVIWFPGEGQEGHDAKLAKRAYEVADAMLKAREG